MQAMEGRDCGLSKSATMRAMALCETAGDCNAALSLFELAVQKGRADADIFSKAMAACLAAGRSKVRASAFCCSGLPLATRHCAKQIACTLCPVQAHYCESVCKAMAACLGAGRSKVKASAFC